MEHKQEVETWPDSRSTALYLPHYLIGEIHKTKLAAFSLSNTHQQPETINSFSDLRERRRCGVTVNELHVNQSLSSLIQRFSVT